MTTSSGLLEGDDGALQVLSCLVGAAEPAVVHAIDRDPRTVVARRCADIPELVSLAEAGRGRVAVVSAGLRHLDGDVVAQLQACGCAVVVLVRSGEDDHRVTALDADAAVGLGADADEDGGEEGPAVRQVVDAIVDAVERLAGAGDGRHPADRSEAGWTVDHRRGTGRHPAGREVPPPRDVRPAGPSASRPALSRRSTGVRRQLGARPSHDNPASGVDAASPALPPGLPSGRVVTVWGSPGAPGRTTVAVGLATELARAGTRVLLVDADTYAASVASHLGILDEAAGLVAAVRAGQEGRLGRGVWNRVAPTVLPGLRVLTGITRSSRWPELRPAGFAAVLAAARELAEIVVVDVAAPVDRDEDVGLDVAAPRRNAVTLVALEQADHVTAVGAADPVGLHRLVRALQELQVVGLDPAPTPTVVVNKLRRSAVGPDPERRVRAALQRFASIDDPVLVPWDAASLDAALLAGRTLGEAAPSSPVRAPLRRLASVVSGRPEPPPRRRVLGLPLPARSVVT